MTAPPRERKLPILIAIDGPAGAGKSTVASALALRLGIPYLDTGAMYRAVALLALRDGLPEVLDDTAAERVIELMNEHSIDIEADVEGTRILIDGEDVSSELRTAECSMMASAVSALSEVRAALVPLQRQLGLEKGGVMEGRDIGSVVLPDAPLKIFLTANTEERARRRHRDLVEKDTEATIEEVRRQQEQRDHQDTSRADSPLQVARGAVVVDTSSLSLEEVIDRLSEEAGNVFDHDA